MTANPVDLTIDNGVAVDDHQQSVAAFLNRRAAR
jgi:hypothetical protein